MVYPNVACHVTGDPQVVQHYTHRRLDDAMRAMMAIDWLAREEEQPGTIDRWRTDGRTHFESEAEWKFHPIHLGKWRRQPSRWRLPGKQARN